MQIGEIKASRGWLVFVIIVSIAILIGSICYWSWLSKDLANGDAVRNIALSIGRFFICGYQIKDTNCIIDIAATWYKPSSYPEQQVSEGLARAAEQLSSEVDVYSYISDSFSLLGKSLCFGDASTFFFKQVHVSRIVT